MHSRTARLTLGAAALILVGAAAFFVITLERQIADRRDRERAFDAAARDAVAALADVRSGQQAYVAAGQGIGFWMPRVDSQLKSAAHALATLQQQTTTADTQRVLTDAQASTSELGAVDTRIRDYIGASQMLMAADVAFTEGGETAVIAVRQLESARRTERQALDAFEASQRKRQAEAAAAGAGGALLIVLVLGVATPRASAEGAPAQTGADRYQHLTIPAELDFEEGARLIRPDELVTAREVTERPTVAEAVTVAEAPTVADVPAITTRVADLPMQDDAELALTLAPDSEDRVAMAGAEAVAASANATSTPAVDMVALRGGTEEQQIETLQTAASLCTDLARVDAPAALQELLARSAALIDASGLIVWLGGVDGADLRPVLAHGYPPTALARMPAVKRTANNAAAAAYRTGALQVVPADAAQSGALVAPLLSPSGCIGAFAAEIKDGREASGAVQALAAILAAQLAAVLGGAATSAAQKPTQRVASARS